MKPKYKSGRNVKNQAGFSLVEIAVAMGILAIFIFVAANYMNSIKRSSEINGSLTTRDRILSAIRNVAGMPAALRSSIRASLADGVTPQNRELNNCVAGTQASSCQNNVEYPLILFSPAVQLDAAGNALGLLPITAARGSAKPMRFDSFGVPCGEDTTDCLLNVYTTFRAQCPPGVLPVTPPATNDPAYMSLLAPMSTCTVAEAIHVTYWVELDASAGASKPFLSAFLNPVSGTVTTSVKLIFGNDPR